LGSEATGRAFDGNREVSKGKFVRRKKESPALITAKLRVSKPSQPKRAIGMGFQVRRRRQSRVDVGKA